jgi:hypothetical protein
MNILDKRNNKKSIIVTSVRYRFQRRPFIMKVETYMLQMHYKQRRAIGVAISAIILTWLTLTPDSLLAQPAKGANKFLGNITTMNSVRSDLPLNRRTR